MSDSLAGHQVSSQDTVNLNYFSELMEDLAEEQVVSNHSGIQAITLQNGAVAVFSQGQDNVLYAIIQRHKGTDGWTQFPLTALPNGDDSLGTVTAFGVGQDSNGNVRIGIGITSGGSPKFYLSEPVDFSTFEYSESFDPATFFTQVTSLTLPSGTVNRVSVSASQAMLAVKPDSGDADYYQVSFTDGYPAATFTLPQNDGTILQFALGQVNAHAGVFVLYENSVSEMVMQFLPNQGPNFTYNLPDGDQPTYFSLIADSAGNNALFVAGSGLYYVANTMQPSGLATILPAAAGQSIAKIVAATNQTTTAIWTLLQPAGGSQGLYLITNLYYQYNATDPGESTTVGQWNQPLQLAGNVSDFSPLQGSHIANQLFYIDDSVATPQLRHFWQDTSTTVWKNIPVPVRGTGQTRSYYTYSMTLKFTTGTPNRTFEGLNVSVTPSSTVDAIINNTPYSLTGGVATNITLSSSGLLTIVNEIDSLQAPNFTVAADFLPQPVQMQMTQKIAERLAAKSAAGGNWLSTATKEDGSPLIPSTSGISSDTLEAISTGITQFLAINGNLLGGGSETEAVAERRFVGLEIRPGHARLLNENELAARTAGDSVVGDIGHVFGDVINWAEDFLTDVVTFVIDTVENTITLTIEAIDETVTFVIDSVEQVFASIEWLFKTIEVALKDLVEFIGFLFEWDDILNTKDALKQLTNNLFTEFNSDVEQISQSFQAWVEQLEADITAWGASGLATATESTPGSFSYPDIYSRLDTDLTIDPKQHWVNTKLPNFLGTTITGGDGQATLPSSVSTLQATGEATGQSLLDSAEQLVSLFTSFLQGVITLEDFLKQLVAIIGDAVLSVFEAIGEAILQVVQDVAASVQTMLTTPIDIPFFSALYKDIAGGDELTLLDFFSLILAIPTTITYKMIKGAAPISDGQLTAAEISAVPAGFFLIDADNDSVLAAEDADLSDLDVFYDVFIAMTRTVRIFSFGGSTLVAVLPIEADAELKIGITRLGKSLEKLLRKVGVGFLLVDNFARLLGIAAATLQKPTSKNVVFTVYFSLAALINSELAKFPKEFRAVALRGFGAIDSIAVTALAVWSFVDTIEDFSDLTASEISAQFSLELFQVLPIASWLGNLAVAGEDDADPIADVAALIVFLAREAGMISSAVSEYFVAGGD